MPPDTDSNRTTDATTQAVIRALAVVAIVLGIVVVLVANGVHVPAGASALVAGGAAALANVR